MKGKGCKLCRAKPADTTSSKFLSTRPCLEEDLQTGNWKRKNANTVLQKYHNAKGFELTTVQLINSLLTDTCRKSIDHKQLLSDSMLHVNHRGGAGRNIFLSKHCSTISMESRKMLRFAISNSGSTDTFWFTICTVDIS
jgi:hypothetical protein